MVEINYAEHLKLRLKLRKFPDHYPAEIYLAAEQKFLDIIERRHIAIKRLKYNNKVRNIMIAYDKLNGKIEIVTIHPITDEKIANRIISGRWVKNE